MFSEEVFVCITVPYPHNRKGLAYTAPRLMFHCMYMESHVCMCSYRYPMYGDFNVLISVHNNKLPVSAVVRR